jgi:hypothetical protein
MSVEELRAAKVLELGEGGRATTEVLTRVAR